MLRKLTFYVFFVTTLIVVLSACRRDEPTPTPTQVPMPPTVAPLETPTPQEDVWNRIQRNGRIIVGTSADYPPFEYYSVNFRLTGFDVALMLDIAETLGLPVEFRDMSFEALADAIVNSQIDVAISAISATSERSDFVDFSNIYYVGDDAVIMRSDVPDVTLTSVEDLARARVGVQAQTVYEQMATSMLVDTGLTHPNNIFTYSRATEAVEALGNREVDFVLLDLQPATIAESTGNFKIAAQGLNPQRFALAAPKGSPALIANLNNALTQLQISGRLDELAELYLGLDELPEITDPAPPTGPETPVPPPTGCVDLMRYIADITFDDENMTNPPVLSPGQPFQKVWRLQNVGTCTWTTSYFMSYVGGNTAQSSMGGQNTFLPTSVPPGSLVDVAVNLVAPLQPGTYQGFWELRNPQAVGIGDRVWVGITVPGAPTPTPPPTATPSPTITFTADRNVITQGECTVLRWSVQNVQAVFLYPAGENWQNYPTVGQGSREVCPNQTTTYELRVIHLDGRHEVRQQRIDVIPNVSAPEIRRFTVDPAFQIFQGQCVTIVWEVVGSVTNVKVSRSGQMLMDPAPFSGSLQDCPPAGEQIYRLEASGQGGNNNAQQVIQVVVPTAIPPTPTPLPPDPPPVVTAFSVTPNQIEVNQCVTIYWTTAGGTMAVRILKDGSVVLDNAPFSGQSQDCPGVAGSITYSIEARNATGETVRQEQTVSVSESVPPNPLANTNWQVATINVNGLPLPGTNLTAYFGSDGQVSVNGGCNTYFGPYMVNGNSISIGPLGGSQLLCGDDIDAQESAYLTALQSAASFEISGNQLVLRNSAGQEVLRFVQL